MLPLATTTIRLDRPLGSEGDADDDDFDLAPDVVADALAVAIVQPGGADAVVSGHKEVVDAVLLAPPTPTIEHTDLVYDLATCESYRVTWVRARRGLGLDHQAAGLKAVKGASGG